MKYILSCMRRAIDDYHMIEEGDKIAVALSGGKDSITLLLALKNLQLFYPKHFDIMALTIDPGSHVFDTTNLEKLCREKNIEYVIEKTDIKEIVFDIRKEKQNRKQGREENSRPCSLPFGLSGLRRSVERFEYTLNDVVLLYEPHIFQHR